METPLSAGPPLYTPPVHLTGRGAHAAQGQQINRQDSFAALPDAKRVKLEPNGAGACGAVPRSLAP